MLFLDLRLLHLLHFVAQPNLAEVLVIIVHPTQLGIVMLHLVLQLNAGLKIRKHQVLLLSLALCIHPLLVFEVFLISEHHLMVDLLQIILLLLFGMVLEVDCSMNVLAEIAGARPCLLSLLVIERHFKLQVAFHIFLIALLVDLPDLAIDFFLLDGLGEFSRVLLLHKLLPEPRLFLGELKVLRLFADNGTPFVDDTASIDRIIPLLLLF